MHANDRVVLQQHVIGGDLGDAGHESDDQQPSVPGHASPNLLEHVPADRVVGHVNPPAVGKPPHLLHQVAYAPVVDHIVSAECRTGRRLVGPASHRDDPGPGGQAQLDGRRPCAARRPGHQQRLALGQTGPVVEGEPGGPVVQRHGCCLGLAQRLRHREGHAGRYGHLLG